MILNEDYFDKLEITDDDIWTDDADDIKDDDNTDSQNPSKLIKSLYSRYTHFMEIQVMSMDVHYCNLYAKTEEWNRISNALKQLSVLFDAYDMDYSQPVASNYPGYTCLLYKDDLTSFRFKDKYTFVTDDFANEDILREYETHAGFVYVFFNLPELGTYRRKCRFMGRMINAVFKYQNIRLTIFHHIGNHVNRNVLIDKGKLVEMVRQRKTYITALEIIYCFFDEDGSGQFEENAKMRIGKMKREKITRQELIGYIIPKCLVQ